MVFRCKISEALLADRQKEGEIRLADSQERTPTMPFGIGAGGNFGISCRH